MMSNAARGHAISIGKKLRRRRQPSLFERHPGQAIVLVALVMIVLLGFTGLAIDGGQLYFLQRDTQNAADAAIMAALFQLCKDPSVAETDEVNRLQPARDAGQAAARQNGFDDAAPNVTVTVTVPYDPGTGLSYNDVEVVIIASKEAQLIQVVYQGPLEVRARTTGHCRAGHPFDQAYAMFGGGSNCSPASVNFQGSSQSSTIVGGVAGNGDVQLSGNGTSVDTCTAAGTGNTVDVPPPPPDLCASTTNGADAVTMPEIWALDDFRLPNGEYAKVANTLGTYHYYAGDLTSLPKNADNTVVPGIYMVEGDIKLNGNDFGTGAEGVTLVTAGEFTVSSGVDVPFTPYKANDLPPMPLVFANYGDRQCTVNKGISMSGSGVFWEGVLYAPNGLISISGATSGTMNGCMIGWVVSVSASQFNITCSPSYFPPIRPNVGLTG